MSVAEAKAHFSECLKQAESGDRVVITRHGKVVAALVSPEDLAELDRRRAGTQVGTLLQLVGLDEDDAFTAFVEEAVRDRTLPRPAPDLE